MIILISYLVLGVLTYLFMVKIDELAEAEIAALEDDEGQYYRVPPNRERGLRGEEAVILAIAWPFTWGLTIFTLVHYFLRRK